MLKKVWLTILMMACLLLLAACGAAAPASPTPMQPTMASGGSAVPQASSADMGFDAANYASSESQAGYESSAGLPEGVEARKVVYRASFSLQTTDYDAAVGDLQQKITVSGGYIESSESHGNDDSEYARTSMTIRIPIDAYGDFKDFLSGLAEVLSSSEQGEDVTAQYFDTEARLTVLTAQEQRILTFIEKAENLEEIFIVERELTRIRTEIEQLTTVKQRLDDLVSYATINVDIGKVREETLLELDDFGSRFTRALRGSVSWFSMAAQSLVLMLVWLWPLLALAAVVLLAWRYVRKRRGLPMPLAKRRPNDERPEDKE